MALNKVRIGDHIELVKIKCGIPNLTVNDVSGINKEKEFFEPSKQIGKDTTNYKIVPPNCFACNLMHVGRDVALPIAINRTDKNKIVSPAYTVFKFRDENVLLKDYFFIFLNSSEKDRFFWFHCDSSVRDGMDWETFCNLIIEVPSKDIQKKYVAVYRALFDNLNVYKRKFDDFYIAYEGYIEKLRRELPSTNIFEFLIERNERNKNGEITFMKGVGLNGFIEPNQDRTPDSLKKCNIFYKGDFVYAPSSFKNGVISYNDSYDKAICTEEYIVFYIKDEKKLDAEYLLMWLKRSELGRFIDFKVIDSVRNRFYFDGLKIISIPLPDIVVQKNIAKIYHEVQKRKQYYAFIKQKIFSICPILVRGSLMEAERG